MDVLEVTPTLAIGAYANIHLCVYRAGLTLEGLEAANRHHRDLIAKHRRTFVLGYAQPNQPLPAADARQRAAVLIEENQAHVAASALVVEGNGFSASVIRSVMTAAFALARYPYPSKCVATGADAGTWLATFPEGRELSPAAVAGALAQLCAAAP